MRSCAAGCSREPMMRRDAALYSVSIRKVDLPPPETPVTQVKVPSGISARDVLQIVAARADDLDAPALLRLRGARRASAISERAGQIFAGERVRVGHDLLRRALGDDLAAMDAGGRADVDDIVGRAGWRPRHARRRSPCCRCRAGASACRAAAHCRAGAGRSTARPARRARRSGRSRSARRAGCAGSRRPTACRNCATGVR